MELKRIISEIKLSFFDTFTIGTRKRYLKNRAIIVEGKKYTGSCCVSFYLTCPNIGDRIAVFYRKADPTQYAPTL